MHLPGALAALATEATFRAWLRSLYRQAWVVYAKPPFGRPSHVLHYLARYTHRVALSNHRLVAVSNDMVAFRWKDYRYYGCTQASRNGDTVCTNQLKIRDQIANAALLAGFPAELTRPETVDYVSAQLATALNAIIDERPAKRADLQRAREMTQTKLANLIAASEGGTTSSAIFSALRAREEELRSIDLKMNVLEEPIEQRMAVIPTWVSTQLQDAAGLVSEAPERARAEFVRLWPLLYSAPRIRRRSALPACSRVRRLRTLGPKPESHLPYIRPFGPANDA